MNAYIYYERRKLFYFRIFIDYHHHLSIGINYQYRLLAQDDNRIYSLTKFDIFHTFGFMQQTECLCLAKRRECDNDNNDARKYHLQWCVWYTLFNAKSCLSKYSWNDLEF